MSVVKFNETKQKQVKSLSNIISLIGKIGSIVLKVAIPFIIIAMFLIFSLFILYLFEKNSNSFKKLLNNKIWNKILPILKKETQSVINKFL